MITIVDYGVGNLKSLHNALRFLDYESRLVNTAEGIESAEKLILPGVGAFGYAIENIRRLRLEEALLKQAAVGTPLLGICLGMQLLMTESYEGGRFRGLDLISGCVKKLEVALKVPHMGWNEIDVDSNARLFQNLPATRYGYFVHSYYCELADQNLTSASTEYEQVFTSAFENEHLFGVQFHPEKSQELGLQILKNFADC
jgi:glutamine amidotransferase